MRRAIAAVATLGVLVSACALAGPRQPATPPADGISLAEAVEIAVAAVREDWQLGDTQGQAMRYADLVEAYGDYALGLNRNTWVWYISIDRRSEGTWIIVDYRDGTVLKVIPWRA